MWHVACMEAGEVQSFSGQILEKETTGKPRRRWENNIKIDPQDVGWEDRDLIDLTQDRDRWRALVNAVMNFRVP